MKHPFKHWYLFLLKGIILILLAIFVFRHPVGALVGLALYIGIALLVTGLFLIIASFSLKGKDDGWGWRLAEGIIDVVFAFILLANPAVTAVVLPFVIGLWMIVYGIILFANSFSVSSEDDSGWWIATLGGVLTVVIGFFITANPLAGAIAVTFWIGLGFLIFGLINVFAGLGSRQAKSVLTN